MLLIGGIFLAFLLEGGILLAFLLVGGISLFFYWTGEYSLLSYWLAEYSLLSYWSEECTYAAAACSCLAASSLLAAPPNTGLQLQTELMELRWAARQAANASQTRTNLQKIRTLKLKLQFFLIHKQCLGSGFVLDPYSMTLRIRIRIRNTDSDSGTSTTFKYVKHFNWKNVIKMASN